MDGIKIVVCSLEERYEAERSNTPINFDINAEENSDLLVIGSNLWQTKRSE